jgi:hypothetical protein
MKEFIKRVKLALIKRKIRIALRLSKALEFDITSPEGTKLMFDLLDDRLFEDFDRVATARRFISTYDSDLPTVTVKLIRINQLINKGINVVNETAWSEVKEVDINLFFSNKGLYANPQKALMEFKEQFKKLCDFCNANKDDPGMKGHNVRLLGSTRETLTATVVALIESSSAY